MELKASSIIAVGGAEDKVNERDILERFVREAGGDEARIAILPTASAIPDGRATFYQELFRELGVASSRHVPIVTRSDAQSASYAEDIADASGVFLTAGDQQRLGVGIDEDTAILYRRNGGPQ